MPPNGDAHRQKNKTINMKNTSDFIELKNYHKTSAFFCPRGALGYVPFMKHLTINNVYQ